MVFKKKTQEEPKYFKSVLLAYSILVFHVLLIAFMLLLVIFFHGMINYMAWIFAGGAAVIIFSGYRFYKRMKEQGKTLREMLRSPPLLGGRSVEVSVLGGTIAFKIDGAGDVNALDGRPFKQTRQLEDQNTIRIREITELVRLLENEMITLEEYNKIKHQILKS